MTEPSVCAVLLTADRPEMTRKAVECFRAQTYENKFLVVWDSGARPCGIEAADDELWIRETPCGMTIGAIRNSAIRVCGSPDIIAHLDSDDYSHPSRISEQVALLQSSGADVVGYREMLFWRGPFNPGPPYGPVCLTCSVAPCICTMRPDYGAWLYSCPNPNYALGTSLCYRREVWERKPFEATSMGEDEKFLRGLKVKAVSAMDNLGVVRVGDNPPADCFDVRMIARIHAGNTSTAYHPRKMEAETRKSDGYWKRVPQWDAYCAETMK